jgi:chromosome segregation ATPase
MFCKAFKMLFLTGAVLGGTGFLLFGTNLGSYLGTVATSLRDTVKDAIPVDLEIKRAEGLIRKIDPQIENCKKDVAQAEVELESLRGSVGDLEQVVGNEEKKLKSGAKLLTGDDAAQYTLASDTSTRRQFERELQRTMDAYRNNQAILKNKRALIERQTDAVSVAKQRLGAVRAEKDNLADQVRVLKTQQHWIETMAANQKRFDLDDSALSQAREALTQVQKRLDVAQKMLENDMVAEPEDAVAKAEPPRDVLKEIREHFGAPAAAAHAVAVECPAAVTR